MIPDNVIAVDIRPIEINDKIIKKVLIDLEHINFGKLKHIQRSGYDIDFVLSLVFKISEDITAEVITDEYEYYKDHILHESKWYKIVFCYSVNENWIGVITIHRMRR